MSGAGSKSFQMQAEGVLPSGAGGGRRRDMSPQARHVSSDPLGLDFPGRAGQHAAGLASLD